MLFQALDAEKLGTNRRFRESRGRRQTQRGPKARYGQVSTLRVSTINCVKLRASSILSKNPLKGGFP
jgi:hypothetical protein